MKTDEYSATGRRKNAVARVWMADGDGKFLVNGREMVNYFPRPTTRLIINLPLELTETIGKFDIRVRTKGGGTTGQAGAVRLAISRALLLYDPELRGKLKSAGLLTRDARMVERKKYGQPGARKRFQFSKR